MKRARASAHRAQHRVSENVSLGRTRAFVEISIRHNGFHVGSFRFTSSRYIRFAFLKTRLTGSNPARGTDISLLSLSPSLFLHLIPDATVLSWLLFLRRSFPGRRARIKVHERVKFRDANRGKKESMHPHLLLPRFPPFAAVRLR